MAFVVEDGTGVANANSLVDLTYAANYFLDRNVTSWDDLEYEQQTAALIKATDYICFRFKRRLSGVMVDAAQALPFPRIYANVIPGVLPDGIKKACCEYAIRAASQDLAPDLPYDETGRLFTKKVEEVGPIKEETTYASSGSVNAPLLYKPYPVPDALMFDFLVSGGGLIRS